MENPLEIPTPPPEQPEPTIPRSTDLSGRILGDFQLIRCLGEGGMGQVFLARQLSLKRQVAVKILRAELASNITSLQRFQQEAEAMARITHANIVQIYAIDQADGLHYMALEYVEGRNLRDFFDRKGPPEVPVAVNIMRQVAAALQRASEHGFVHRDIKPENILLTRKGEVKVADFGLSRCFTGDQPLNLTQSGVTMGTPLYMSPEQVQGRQVDPRSDIYSFGVTCYHMLAGEPPFKGQTPFEVAFQHVQDEPKKLIDIRPDLPPDLCAVVHKMMAKKPDDRYQTAREILRDLARLKEGLPTTAAQLALLQSGTTLDAASANSPSLSSSTRTEALPAPVIRWRRWAIFALLFVSAGSFGAVVHWKRTRPPESKSAFDDFANRDELANPSKALRKELSKRLNESGIKSDLEVTNAVLDLAMLNVGDAVQETDPEAKKKRAVQALALFERKNLQTTPALVEAQKFFKPQGQYLHLISTLGKGIVYSQLDMPNESNDEFIKVMVPTVSAKGKLSSPVVDAFLWKYDRWKRLVADSLDRNAKNLSPTKLDDNLSRYRGYTSKMP